MTAPCICSQALLLLLLLLLLDAAHLVAPQLDIADAVAAHLVSSLPNTPSLHVTSSLLRRSDALSHPLFLDDRRCACKGA